MPSRQAFPVNLGAGGSALPEPGSQASEFHTLVDTACSIIEAPHQQGIAQPDPGTLAQIHYTLAAR